jgi:hypothetical protein
MKAFVEFPLSNTASILLVLDLFHQEHICCEVGELEMNGTGEQIEK